MVPYSEGWRTLTTPTTWNGNIHPSVEGLAQSHEPCNHRDPILWVYGHKEINFV